MLFCEPPTTVRLEPLSAVMVFAAPEVGAFGLSTSTGIGDKTLLKPHMACAATSTVCPPLSSPMNVVCTRSVMFTCMYGVAASASAVHKFDPFGHAGIEEKLPGKLMLTSFPALLACRPFDA